MRLANRAALAAAAGAVVIAVGLVSGAMRTEAAIDAKAVIEARQQAMKDNAGHMKAINGFVESGQGDAAMVAEHATAIAAIAKKIPELFPEGTSLADGHGALVGLFRFSPLSAELQRGPQKMEEVRQFDGVVGGIGERLHDGFLKLGCPTQKLLGLLPALEVFALLPELRIPSDLKALTMEGAGQRGAGGR